MRAWFAPGGPAISPEEAAQLRAGRETALQQIIRGVLLVSFLALVTNAVSALPYGDWSSTALYAVLFVVLLALALARPLPFQLRGGIFVGLLFAVAAISLVSLVVSTAQQNAELEAARARLAAQATQLEKATSEAQAARQAQADQSESLQRRAALLGLNAEVARAASALRDPAELLQTAVNLISQ